MQFLNLLSCGLVVSLLLGPNLALNQVLNDPQRLQANQTAATNQAGQQLQPHESAQTIINGTTVTTSVQWQASQPGGHVIRKPAMMVNRPGQVPGKRQIAAQKAQIATARRQGKGGAAVHLKPGKILARAPAGTVFQPPTQPIKLVGPHASQAQNGGVFFSPYAQQYYYRGPAGQVQVIPPKAGAVGGEGAQRRQGKGKKKKGKKGKKGKKKSKKGGKKKKGKKTTYTTTTAAPPTTSTYPTTTTTVYTTTTGAPPSTYAPPTGKGKKKKKKGKGKKKGKKGKKKGKGKKKSKKAKKRQDGKQVKQVTIPSHRLVPLIPNVPAQPVMKPPSSVYSMSGYQSGPTYKVAQSSPGGYSGKAQEGGAAQLRRNAQEAHPQSGSQAQVYNTADKGPGAPPGKGGQVTYFVYGGLGSKSGSAPTQYGGHLASASSDSTSKQVATNSQF